MTTKFLFMDEKFSDPGMPLHARATSLTGVLLEADKHREFRESFYTLIHRVVGDDPHVISPMPEVHAMNLFPGKDDAIKFDFFEGLVKIVGDLGVRIYRVGYRPAPQLLNIVGGKEISLLALCFMGLLYCLEDESAASSIWPVMEIDQKSRIQDGSFAGLIQSVDYLTSRLGPETVSIQNSGLGEVLYATKRSACGSLVDCMAYLLHARFLRSIGQQMTPFKSRLADIASRLDKAVAFDEVVQMTFGVPPAGYQSKGPIRFMAPIGF